MTAVDHPHNPHARQMADEAMVRTLAAQAAAIWPQERPLLARLTLPPGARILDVGCGTGEITERLATLFPEAHVHGVDLLDGPLATARARCAAYGPRVSFATADLFHLPDPADTWDLVVCRHVLQSVPEPARALAELVRVTRPGGRLHLLLEDYGMIHLHPTRLDTMRFWFEGPRSLAAALGTDAFVGRSAFHALSALPLEDVAIDYLTVDTLRVPRETLAAIFTSWRDGWSEVIAEHTAFTLDEVRAHFDDTLACVRDPRGYLVWHVPIATARKRPISPGGSRPLGTGPHRVAPAEPA